MVIDIISKEELEQMYLSDEMSMSQIAKIVGISRYFVSNLMSEYNIERRMQTCILSKEELYQIYWNEEMSMPQIAKRMGVTRNTVHTWMKKHGIKSKSISESLARKCIGEKNGNWHGGISFEPYCDKFNNIFKESIRTRDDFTCQLCGYEQKLGGQKLSIHHIHYDKENCAPDVVALCRSCNARVNGDRNYWEQYFEDLLLKRELLNYSIT